MMLTLIFEASEIEVLRRDTLLDASRAAGSGVCATVGEEQCPLVEAL